MTCGKGVSSYPLFLYGSVQAQTAPSAQEASGYEGLLKAAHEGDVDSIQSLLDAGADLHSKDSAGRTALHVAAFASHHEVLMALAESGADLNALENDAYDVVTIAAVANDIEVLRTVLESGASAGNVTSRYDGTALIAAAHLGHHQAVELLIEYKAPLDHVNNLAWTALIEAVVLGDGGADHTETVRLLLQAGADQSIGDRQGVTPLQHARDRGYAEMISLFEQRITR